MNEKDYFIYLILFAVLILVILAWNLFNLLKTVLLKANLSEEIILYAIKKIEFRGRQTESNPNLDTRWAKLTMLVEFSNNDYVFKLLGASKNLKKEAKYNQLTFRRLVPFAYRKASRELEKNRLPKVKMPTGARAYDSRIKFI